MTALPMMTAEEISRCEIVADEAGFGAMQTAAGNLPLQELKVDAEISALLSQVTLRQVFVNNHDRPLEATYIFPLPNRAAVVGFKMFVNDRVIDGILKERGEARREYREAIEAGHRASIVEEDRPDVFTMRVGNIAPGEQATIELTMTTPLIFAEGEATFRFPLVVAPRYIPGKALEGPSVGDGFAHDTDAVPDASRITPPVLLPGFPNPVRLAINVAIDHRAISIANIRSSLHSVSAEREGGTSYITIQPGEKVDRDFILRFDVAEKDVVSALTLVPDEKGDEGTYFVTLLPPARDPGSRRPRDVVFVLDRSGSMGGWKMVAARRALGRMVDTLAPDDRFGLIAFDTSIDYPEFSGRKLSDATNRNRYRAIEWLSTVDARGGTEMAEPIFQALDLVRSGEQNRDQVVVLVTDGQVGNERQLMKGVSKKLRDSRVFTVGIDQAVNAGFLERLAEIGQGRCELVESEDRLDEVMERLHRTIDTPLVTEISVNLVGAEKIAGTSTPERPPTLFAGAPLVIAGRYKSASKDVEAHVRGADSGGATWSKDLPAKRSENLTFASLWAKTKLREMEDAYTIAETSYGTNRDDLRARIIDTSLKFNVLCRFTSFVAVDRSEKVKGDLHQVVQPVESPAGWEGSPSMQQAPMSSMKKRKSAMRASGAMAPPPPGAPMPLQAPMASSASYASNGFGGGASFDDEATHGFAMEEMASFDKIASPVMPQEARRERSKEFEAKLEAPQPTPRRAPRSAHTQAGTLRPNVRRLSPEAARGEALTPAHDVFVAAIFLFELITGRSLFPGTSDVAVLSAIIAWRPDTLRSSAAELGDLLPVLEKALAANPNDRYPNITAFAAAIEHAVGRGQVIRPVAAATKRSSLPQRLGEFEIGEALYTGSRFIIAMASAPDGAPCIVRVIPAAIAEEDPEWAEAYLEENTQAASLAELADSGLTDDGEYWAVYRADGVASFASVLEEARRSPVALDNAVAMVLDIAKSLSAVSDAGLSASWMTPDDFILCRDGHIRALGIGALPSSEKHARPGVIDRIKSFFTGEPDNRRDDFWK